MFEPRGIHKGLKVLQLSTLFVILAVPLLWGTTLAQSDFDGEVIFREYCAGCHTIGGGDLAGPDLMGVTQRRDRQWLSDFIAEPDRVLASGDPIASSLYQQYGNLPMPNLDLSSEQVEALIAYLEERTDAGLTPQPSPTPILPQGDLERGQALFMGNVHFENDGPPCMGCHNLGNNGALGGGVLGPDLTSGASTYNEASLANALAKIPWPTMKPIFEKHPLTPEEQADLRAFLMAESGQQATNKEFLVIGISLAGFVAVVVVIGIIYRSRLRGVRRPLVERIRSGKG